MSIRETNFAKQKYVRGVKRNQIIQRWLQGIEDPLYDVFPTKKEGKYIVKLRDSPIESTYDEQPVMSTTDEQPVTENQDNDIPEPINETSDTEPLMKPPPRKPSTMKSSSMIKPQSLKRSVITPDSTINLEILEQLRSLGEELRNDRFKKEQKQYIKQVVNKELSKSRIRSRYIPDTLVPESEVPVHDNVKQESEPIETVIDEPEPIFRSRIRR